MVLFCAQRDYEEEEDEEKEVVVLTFYGYNVLLKL